MKPKKQEKSRKQKKTYRKPLETMKSEEQASAANCKRKWQNPKKERKPWQLKELLPINCKPSSKLWLNQQNNEIENHKKTMKNQGKPWKNEEEEKPWNQRKSYQL